MYYCYYYTTTTNKNNTFYNYFNALFVASDECINVNLQDAYLKCFHLPEMIKRTYRKGI